MLAIIVVLCLAVAVNSASLNVQTINSNLKSKPISGWSNIQSRAVVNGTFTVPLDHNRPQDGRSASLVSK